MWAVLTVAVISLIAVELMVQSAVAVGFTVLVGPVIVAELVLLAALYLIWRELSGEQGGETERIAAVPRRRAASPPSPRARVRTGRAAGAGPISLVGRTGRPRDRRAHAGPSQAGST
jgi:hypothetical protein